MNPTSKALELVEPLLITGHWAFIHVNRVRCVVVIGLYDTATRVLLIDLEGQIVEDQPIGRCCTGNDPACPTHGVAASNARQNEFYRRHPQ